MDSGEHEIAVFGGLEINGGQREEQKNPKTEQRHQSAHRGALPPAERQRVLSPVSADGPNQTGRQQDEKADRRKYDRQHSSKEGPRCGGPQKFLPCDPGSARKAGIWWRRRRWCSCGEVCPMNLLDPGRLFSRSGNPYLRRTAGRTKGELPFNGMSAAVAIALHIFHVTRAFLAWQTAQPFEPVLKKLQFFRSRYEMGSIDRVR
jgi:hypothetical protein